MGGDKPVLGCVLAVVVCFGLSVLAQMTGGTVRHHKVAVEDPNFPPELIQAESALDRNDYRSAEPLLKGVVGKNPANYRAWFDLGLLYSAQGQTEDSIAAYRKSVAAKADVFESNLNLGLMLAKAKQPDAAQFLRAATNLRPVDHVVEGLEQAWLSLAHVVEPSQPQEALEAYQQAARLEPKDPEPHLGSAALLVKQNQFAEAEQQYQQVLALDPKSADAMVGIANIYVRGDRLGEAAATLRKLVALRPDYVPAHVALARVLAADGNHDAAIAEYQAALKLAPADGKAQLELAEALVAAGKYAEAQPIYQSLLKANQNDPMLHYSLGQAYMKQRKFPDAEKEFLAAITLKGDFGIAYGDLAFAANENKNYQTTIKALDIRAKFLPELPVTYFLRASAYDHLRAYKEAAVNYHLFLQAANGQFPDQEWQARHRLIAIEPKK